MFRADRAESAGSTVNRRVGIVGGIHGNEILGINLVKSLASQFDVGDLRVGRLDSEVVLIEGNLEAIEKGARGTSEYADLNRCFKAGILDEDLDNDDANVGGMEYERQRAKELAPILGHLDVMVDIHATNKPSEPFVRVGGYCSSRHVDLSSWFVNLANISDGSNATKKARRKKLKLLLDPFCVLADEPSTTDEFVNLVGGTGICIETGHSQDLSLYQATYQSIIQLLSAEAGVAMTNRSAFDFNCSERLETGEKKFWFGSNSETIFGTTASRTAPEIVELNIPIEYRKFFDLYKLEYRQDLKLDSFEFAEGCGESNWQPVARKEILGYQEAAASSDSFEVKKSVQRDHQVKCFSPLDGVMLFPKLKSLQSQGRALYYVAKNINTALPSEINTPTLAAIEPRQSCRTKRVVENYIRRVNQFNRDSFMSFVWGKPPGLYRKGTKEKYSFVTADNIDEELGLMDPESRAGSRDGERAVSPNDADNDRVGMPFGTALQEYRKFLQRQVTAGSKLKAPKIAKSVFLYEEDDVLYPVYPRVYRELESHYAKAEAPYKSPVFQFSLQISYNPEDEHAMFELPVRQIYERNWKIAELAALFQDSSPDYISCDAAEELYNDNDIVGMEEFLHGALKFHTEVQQKRIMYRKSLDNNGTSVLKLGFELWSDVFLSLSREARHSLQNVQLQGTDKDEVGYCFVRLRDILRLFGRLLKEDVYVVHPAFTDEGFVGRNRGLKEVLR